MIYALFAYKPNAKPFQIIIFCPELNFQRDFCFIYAQPQRNHAECVSVSFVQETQAQKTQDQIVTPVWYIIFILYKLYLLSLPLALPLNLPITENVPHFYV